jgi:flagellar hook protein FlgE
MSMMRSLTAGMTGLKGFQTKMDVIGNNIANVNTAGFKGSRVTFAELISQDKAKAGSRFNQAPSIKNQIGLGTRVSSISRNFDQGALNSTNLKTDLAIDGKGFFLVNDGNQNMVTRAGNFKFNRDGFLVTEEGLSVQGFNANADGSVISGGSAQDIQINFDDIFQPKRTQNVFLSGNLNANTSKAQVVSQVNAFTFSNGSFAEGGSEINNLAQASTAYVDGDTVEISGQDGAGNTVTATFTYGAANDGTTVGDLLSTINAAYDADAGTATGVTSEATQAASAVLQDGKIVLRDSELGESDLSIDLTNGTGNTGSLALSSFTTNQVGENGEKIISNTVYDSQGEAHTLLLELTQEDYNTWTVSSSFLNGENVTNGATETLVFDDEGNINTEATASTITGDAYTVAFNPGNGAEEMQFEVNLKSAETGALTQYDGSSSANFVKQDGYAKGELTDFVIDADGLIVGTYSNGKSKNLASIGIASVANENALDSVGNGLFQLNTQAGDLIVGTSEALPETTVNSRFLEASNVDLAEEFTEMIVAQRAYQSNARVITTSDQLLQEVVSLKR